MADPMDYTMDEGRGDPAQNSNSVPQCQYRSPHSSPNSNTFASQPRDAHHYDPVHNTESWHQANGTGSQSRQPPPYAGTHNISQWGTPSWGMPSWPGLGEGHRGSQGPDLPVYPQQPGFMGMAHPSSWGEMRGYEPQTTSFGYISGMYGGNGDPSEPNTAGRNSQTTSTLSQASPMRRYTNIGQIQQAYVERAARTREEAVRNLNARLRAEREAAGIPQNPSSFDYLHSRSSLDSSPPRRRDNPDWDSDDDDDPLSAPDSDIYANPYRAGAMFNGDMDDERRMAAARASLAGGKKVPSREFVASLEKLDPKEIKEADRTCMICYNEFGIQNPDGVVEQPIRLPKCKHVFGDKCIKKWFEDSDSCPYCRDKLPSEQVHRKHPNMDSLYQAHARRNQLAQAAAQAHSSRARAGYPGRASDELSYGSTTSQYYRHSQEEYHYIMRGEAPDAWSYSPPNRSRESPENRRRQARGRAGLGRPTSVGSARLVSSNPPNPQTVLRAHLQSITPNTLNTAPTNAPRRSITPALSRQPSTGSPPTVTTPPRSRLSEASSSSSSEEASPPVAVGSGVAAGNNHSPPSGARSYPHYMNSRWADPYRNYLTPSEGYFPPGRPPNSRAEMEHSGQTTSSEARSADSDISPHSFGDLNFNGNVHEALSGNRWSR